MYAANTLTLAVAIPSLTAIVQCACQNGCFEEQDEASFLQLAQTVTYGIKRSSNSTSTKWHPREDQRCYVARYCDTGSDFPTLEVDVPEGKRTNCFNACRNPHHITSMDTSEQGKRDTTPVDTLHAKLLLSQLSQPEVINNNNNNNNNVGGGPYRNNNMNNNGGSRYRRARFRELTDSKDNGHSHNGNRGHGQDHEPKTKVFATKGHRSAAKTQLGSLSKALRPFPAAKQVSVDVNGKEYELGKECLCALGQQGYHKHDRVHLYIPNDHTSATAGTRCGTKIRVVGKVNMDKIRKSLADCCRTECEKEGDKSFTCASDCEDYFGISVSGPNNAKKAEEAINSLAGTGGDH